MFETNIQNNSALISLARAAEITGYHQDYLGQLCRLGRLPAKKVGRNWFTSQEALQKIGATTLEENMTEAVEQAVDEQVGVQSAEQASAPGLIQAVTISQVEGLPIALRTIPRPVQVNNSVQSILTNLRIESLQKEVAHLRSLLNRLMEEVARHTSILEGRSSEMKNIQDSLRHSYISNLDFNPVRSSRTENVSDGEEVMVGHLHYRSSEDSEISWPGFTVVTWLTGVAVLAGLVFMGLSVASGSFFGPQPSASVTSIYHQPAQQRSWEIVEPTVAGASSDTAQEPTQ